MIHRPYTISWNLTQRCNLRCAHCYLGAFPGADPHRELSTEECFRVVDEIAAVNPDVLLGERQARLMRQNGIQGASVSDRNVDEVPVMIDLARVLGARVLNFFFLVRTGRGKHLTEITPEQYERILTDLARVQGVATPAGDNSSGPEVPWRVTGARAGELLIRAKCAPHFRRILLAEDPSCAYRPGASGGRRIDLPAEQSFGIAAKATLTWTAEAQARLKLVPGFARGMVTEGVERYARERGKTLITSELMQEVRERMAARFPPFTRR